MPLLSTTPLISSLAIVETNAVYQLSVGYSSCVLLYFLETWTYHVRIKALSLYLAKFYYPYRFLTYTPRPPSPSTVGINLIIYFLSATIHNLRQKAQEINITCNNFMHLCNVLSYISLDDVAKAFETLLEDNRSGSVMWLRKHGDNVIASYVQNKWSDVE